MDEENRIVAFVLSTGHHIVGEETGESDGSYFLSRPLAFQMFQDQQNPGQVGLAFEEWFSFRGFSYGKTEESDVEFAKPHIITYREAAPELQQQYQNAINPPPQQQVLAPEQRIVTPDDMLDPTNLTLSGG